MEKKMNVCCLFGGKSTEYEVSLSSAFAIMSNLDSEKYNLIKVGITKNGQWFFFSGSLDSIKKKEWCTCPEQLQPAFLSPIHGDFFLYVLNKEDQSYQKIPLDVVFPMVHGAFCEDGTLQGLLELNGIPFVGSGCTSSALCMDKAFTKLVLNNYKIPQAQVKVVTRYEVFHHFSTIQAEIEGQFHYPIFVKPSNAGSSIGVSKVTNVGQFQKALETAASFDDKVLIEEFVKGREIEVAVIGNTISHASTCGEINPGSDFYDYETKYITDTASYFIPARIQPETAEKIRTLAVKIYTILSCRGLARVDFFVREQDGKEEIIFNEINTLPGFTSISMYPKLWIQDGETFPQLVDSLVKLAFEA